MNNLAKPSYNSSAYPLKAYKGYSDQKNTKPAIRIFPMINPYRISQRVIPLDSKKIPVDIELTNKAWFNHYE